ncbi:unnamed protein product [Linum tenue]|uniref:Uncharacterized protein n=1 Tax=Linum tenue TaxID=586396 RepID=A0AAV0PL48_9ROSI|nr:unnamed protein product [Linum tenue]
MVLWEITLATAYFLGLKRTYRLALKLQRKAVSPKHPKIREFLHRRTRAVFSAALSVHQNIQQRDLEVGRNVGNWILRWLDRMKPSAGIRPHDQVTSSNVRKITQSSSSANNLKNSSGSVQSSRNGESSNRHLFSSYRATWSKPFPTIAMMIRPPRPAGTTTQYRHLNSWTGPEMFGRSPVIGTSGFGGLLRKDVMQYLLQN